MNVLFNVFFFSVMVCEVEVIVVVYGDVMICKIFEKEECEKFGMGVYFGVFVVFINFLKFIYLCYLFLGVVIMKLVIVGKGLIFDSGGYNLKIGFGCMIEFMKFDMGGVVVVFGVVKVIVVIKFEGVEVNFVVVVCENMISGGGMRFGDILIVFNGKIIEVNNIDVEG